MLEVGDWVLAEFWPNMDTRFRGAVKEVDGDEILVTFEEHGDEFEEWFYAYELEVDNEYSQERLI